MIANKIIDIVQAKLLLGESCRKIGEELGISRSSVSRIARQVRQAADDSDRIEEPIGEMARCPVCGGRTKLPCLYCQVVDKLKKMPKGSGFSEESGDEKQRKKEMADFFRIRLFGAERRRYDEIHQWRMKQKNPHFTNIPEDWPFRLKTCGNSD